MATATRKNTRKTSTNTAQEKLAEDLEELVGMELHALFDIAINYPDSELDVFTLQTIVNNLSGTIGREFGKVEKGVPVDHPVSIEIDSVVSAVDGMRELMSSVTDSAYSGMSDEATARCLYAFTVDLAFAFERAQEALGQVASIGFRTAKSADYYEQVVKEQDTREKLKASWKREAAQEARHV